MGIEQIQYEIKPQNGTILVAQDVQEDRTKSGVILTEGARKQFLTGVVVARADDAPEVYTIGTRVGIRRFAGVKSAITTDDGQSYPVIFLNHKDITAIMLGDAKIESGEGS